jgi:hypothetical protein
MKKVKVRIYKDPNGKGEFINPTKKFLQKAAAGMQVGQDMMSLEDRIVEELKNNTTAEDIADILEAEYGVKYYEGLNMVDDVINYVYDDYANDIKNAELSDSELIPEEEEPEPVKKPPLYNIDEPWVSDEDPEEGWDDFGEDSGEEDEDAEEEEEEDLSSNKSKQPKSAQQQQQSPFNDLVNRQPNTGGSFNVNKLFPNPVDEWKKYGTPVNKKGGNVNKGKFVKSIVRGLHKAAEGVEQQANESSILDTPIKGREAHINNFRRGIKNLGNEFYAKQIFDQTQELNNQVRSLPPMAQNGMQVEGQDFENPMHHLQAYAGSVGNIFRQPMNQIHGAGYENLPEARKGREQRQAERQQRNMGKDFRRMFGDMAVGYMGVPGMPNYIQMITPQIQTGPSSTEGTRATTGPLVDIEYKKGPWWTGKREWTAKGLPMEMMMGMVGGRRGMPGGYYNPGYSSSSSWNTHWTSPGEVIRTKSKVVNSAADPAKNSNVALNNNATASSDSYFKNEIPGFIDYGQDWAGNYAKSKEIAKELSDKEDLLLNPGDPSQYGYMIDPATGEVVKNPKGTDVDQRGLVWSGQYDDKNTDVDESLVWSNPISQEEFNADPNKYHYYESYIVTNPDGTQSSRMGDSDSFSDFSYTGSEFSPWQNKLDEATDARRKAFNQSGSYLVNMPKEMRAKNYKELNKTYGDNVLDANGDFTEDYKNIITPEYYPVMDYPFATPSKVTTQTTTNSSQPQSNQSNTQTQSNSQPSPSAEQKGSGDMTAEFTNLKNTGLGVLNQWDAYNEGLKGFSTRVLGKGKVNGMIDDSRAMLEAVSPADFCSQDIDGQIADIQAKKQEYANVLTPEDKGYLSQLESMLATAKGKCAQKQFGGPISGVGPDQYGNLTKFVYGGDEDIPISPIVAYDNNDIQSKNVDDPFMFRNGGLYKFAGPGDSQVNSSNSGIKADSPAPGWTWDEWNALPEATRNKFSQTLETQRNQSQTQTRTQTQGRYNAQNYGYGYPTAPSPMRQIFDMFNPIKKDFTWLSQRDYPRTADGQIYNPQGQGQNQGQGQGTPGQGQTGTPQAGYIPTFKYTKKGPFWNREKTLTVSGEWYDPNNPNAGKSQAGSGSTQNNVTANNANPSNWHAPMVLPGTETQAANTATTASDVSRTSSTTPEQPRKTQAERYGFDQETWENMSWRDQTDAMNAIEDQTPAPTRPITVGAGSLQSNPNNSPVSSDNPYVQDAKAAAEGKGLFDPNSVNIPGNNTSQYNLTNPQENILNKYQSPIGLQKDPLAQKKAWNESGYEEPDPRDPNYDTIVRTRADQAWKQQGIKSSNDISVQDPFYKERFDHTYHRFSDGSPAVFDYETGRYNPATEIPEKAYGGYMPEYMAYGGYMPSYQGGGPNAGSGPFDPNNNSMANGSIGPCSEEQTLNAAPGDPCYNEGYSKGKGTPQDFSVQYDINDAKTLDLKATSRLKNLAGFGLRANAGRKEMNYNKDYLADNTTSDNREAANELDYTGGYSGLNQRIMSKSGAGATGFNRVVGEAAFVKRGGELKYQKGGVYDLTQEEIGQILAAGGQIKFIK